MDRTPELATARCRATDNTLHQWHAQPWAGAQGWWGALDAEPEQGAEQLLALVAPSAPQLQQRGQPAAEAPSRKLRATCDFKRLRAATSATGRADRVGTLALRRSTRPRHWSLPPQPYGPSAPQRRSVRGRRRRAATCMRSGARVDAASEAASRIPACGRHTATRTGLSVEEEGSSGMSLPTRAPGGGQARRSSHNIVVRQPRESAPLAPPTAAT